MKRLVLILIVLHGISVAFANESPDSATVFFKQGSATISATFDDNRSMLDSIYAVANKHLSDTSLILNRVTVVGSSSPEGSAAVNRRFSQRRAQALSDSLSLNTPLDSSEISILAIGRNWTLLRSLVESDPDMPMRASTLTLLDQIISQVNSGIANQRQLSSLQRLAGGKPYAYMYRHIFPKLRYAAVTLSFTEKPKPLPTPLPQPTPQPEPAQTPAAPVQEPAETIPVLASTGAPLFALKTNLLYDLLAVPNLALEFHIADAWSVSAGWNHSWWRSSDLRRSWRFNCIDLALRRWFSPNTDFTGHHVGIFGQYFTYDFAFGSHGYLGGKPLGNSLQNGSYSVGVEYGYSLPIARRFNIDFNIGLGYMSGKYYEYTFVDDHSVWQGTKNRRWLGPVKAEISLVWLIGKTRDRAKKGGAL